MDIPSLLSSLSSALSLGQALLNERDRHKAASIQLDLTDKLLQAQTQASQVLAAIVEKDGLIQVLSERVRHLEADQSEKARYELAELGVGGKFFAYQLRPVAELGERSNEPPHFLCQPCLDIRQHKSALRLIEFGGKPYRYVCTACGSAIPMG